MAMKLSRTQLSTIKKRLLLISLLIPFGIAYWYVDSSLSQKIIPAQTEAQVISQPIPNQEKPKIIKPLRDYGTILEDGATSKISPDYAFPLSKQYKSGCYAFAVNHIVEYKYNEKIDLLEAEKKINKPREELWSAEHIKNFNETYNLKLSWYKSAEDFFRFLEDGEPVMIQYRYYHSETYWTGHFVAVYTFDDKGVWVSESISNTRIRLPYSDIFDEGGKQTIFSFATVERL